VRRRRVAVLGGVLLAALLAGPSAVPAGAAPGAPVVDRTVRDPRITEGSGLAESPTRPGVLWTHNDSGNPPVMYALGPDGSVAAAVRIRGTDDEDWEAMAAYRDGDGRAMLAVADIGDNRAARRSVQVVLVAEPALHDATVSPARLLRLRYPDGPADAETLLVDAQARRMYVVTKGFGSTVYQVPEQVWPGPPAGAPAAEGTLVRIATVPLILVTDGVIGPGHHPLLRTYGELAVLPPITADVVGGSLQPLAQVRLPSQQQGEGLALTPQGQVLLSSEGTGQPVLRLPMPPELAAELPSATPSPSSSSPSSLVPAGGRTAAASPAPRGSGAVRWVVVVLGLAGALAVGTFALVLARRP